MGNTCGITVPSTCVPWASGPLVSFNWVAFTETNCNPDIGKVIRELDLVVKSLKETLDMTRVTNTGCDCIPVPCDNTWWNLANSILKLACDLKTRVGNLEGSATGSDISNKTVNVDMSCLSSNCGEPPYTVSYLFGAIFAELCRLGALVGELAAASSLSMSAPAKRLYSPNI